MPPQPPPQKEPSCVEIAHRRLRHVFMKGDSKINLDPMTEHQAERAAALAVGSMLVDGLWLSNGSARMKMEFPLRPDTMVSLSFTGRPIQSDIDTLVKVLQTLKATLPTTSDIGPDGFSPSVRVAADRSATTS